MHIKLINFGIIFSVKLQRNEYVLEKQENGKHKNAYKQIILCVSFRGK